MFLEHSVMPEILSSEKHLSKKKKRKKHLSFCIITWVSNVLLGTCNLNIVIGNEKQRQDSKVGRLLWPWSIQTKGLSGSRLAFVSKGIKKQRIVSGDEQDNTNFNL